MSGVVNLPSMGGGIDVGKFKILNTNNIDFRNSGSKILGNGFVVAFTSQHYLDDTARYNGSFEVIFKDKTKQRKFGVTNINNIKGTYYGEVFIAISNSSSYWLLPDKEAKYPDFNYDNRDMWGEINSFSSKENIDMLINNGSTSSISSVAFYEKDRLNVFDFKDELTIQTKDAGYMRWITSWNALICYVPKE